MKSFVVDTNVFIHKPDAILSFRDNEVVVPLWVLEELDKLKTFSDERGRNARQAIRLIESIGKRGNLSRGVRMENGSLLRVVLTHEKDIPVDLRQDSADNKILLTALTLKKEGRQVFFVSKDINARVKATALGIMAVDYEKQKVNLSDLYAGYRPEIVPAETLAALRSERRVPWHHEMRDNEFLVLSEKGGESAEIARYSAPESSLVLVERLENPVTGVSPLNDNQRIAISLLLDESIRLVTLVGKAGTGKTLLAIACGLKKVIEDKAYSRVLVARPVVPMGKDIGYLPGAKAEKLSPWMQPLFDNLDYIMSVYRNPAIKNSDWLLTNKMIEIEALTYIRGRSLPNQFIVIDEAQNLSPHEIKTIVSRAGEGTKMVLTGDPYQIDSPYLDSNSNGLTYLVEAFKGQHLFGHITLEKSERSRLAELAAEIL